MIVWRFPNWEYLNAKEEEYPGTKRGWFLATFMFVALPTYAAFKITQYAVEKTYGKQLSEKGNTCFTILTSLYGSLVCEPMKMVGFAYVKYARNA